MKTQKRYYWCGGHSISILKNFLVILMIIICCIDLVFLFWYKERLSDFKLDDYSMFLTILGFFFAFAGINIYSIFNTNIADEKNKLVELQQEYQKSLDGLRPYNDFTQSLLNYFFISQSLFSAKKFNSRLFDSIFSLERKNAELISMLKEMRITNIDYFSKYQNSFRELTLSIMYSLVSFRDSIKTVETTFWGEITGSDQEHFIATLNVCIEKLKHTANGKTDDIFGNIETNERKKFLPFVERAKEAWRILILK